MRTEYITIKEGKFLDSIYKRIPSNVILHKTLCGIGATSLELSPISQRNSIICEPNVPVIEGKCRGNNGRKRKDIIGVTADVDIFDVYDYMANEKISYKKILVTPESFHKVLKAAEALEIDIYSEYFMMFDECERATKDSEYRETITLPMNDFFKFKEKAFVSATTLEISDPRFEQQGFEKIIIRPDYDVATPVKLITTNNIYQSLVGYLNQFSESDEKVFVFFNSVKAIASIIKNINGLLGMSSVFCSKTAKKELIASGIKQVFSDFKPDSVRKVNFMTARFNSAVDIKLGYGAHVLIVTDIHRAEHSIIDPQTDAIQIAGRFRDGRKSVAIISNTDSELAIMDGEERKQFFQDGKAAFEAVKRLYLGFKSGTAKYVLTKVLNLLPYSEFLYADDSLNSFMVDSFNYREDTRKLYLSPESLLKSYREPVNGMNHWSITHSPETYQISDKEIKIQRALRDHGEKVRYVIERRNEIIAKKASQFFVIPDPTEQEMLELHQSYPVISTAINRIGIEETWKHRHSEKLLAAAIRRHDAESTFLGDNEDFLIELYNSFAVGSKTEFTPALRKFQNMSKKHGLDIPKGLDNFKKFFKADLRQLRDGSGARKRYIVITAHLIRVD